MDTERKQRRYEDRLKSGGYVRLPGSMLPPEAAAALDEIQAATGLSKPAAIGAALVEYAALLRRGRP